TLAQTKLRCRGPHSFEHLHQRPFVSSLDAIDPFLLIDEIEHVDRQFGSIVGQLDPNRPGRRGDDHRQHCEAMRIAHVDRDVNESRMHLALPDEAEHDTCDADVRADDVDQDVEEQAHEHREPTHRRLQRSKSEGRQQQQRRQNEAEHDMAERNRVVQQQPHHDQNAQENGRYASHGASPATAALGSADNTASIYVCGAVKPCAAACKYVITGSAAIVRPMQSKSSSATGAASMTRSRGVVRPTTLQNRRMPIRVSETIAASPVMSIAPTKIHDCTGSSAVGAIPTAADNMANFEMNPESGGNPATSSAQHTNVRPRNAIAAGIAMPTSSSTPSGSGASSIPNAEYDTAETGACS